MLEEFKPGKYIIYYTEIKQCEDDSYLKQSAIPVFNFTVEANTLEELQSHYYENGFFLRAEMVK